MGGNLIQNVKVIKVANAQHIGTNSDLMMTTIDAM
jgi:hypothetical protein